MVLTQTQLEDLLSSQATYSVGSGYADLIPGAIPVRDARGELGFVSPGLGAIDQVVKSITAAGGSVVQLTTYDRSVPEPNDGLRTQVSGADPGMSGMTPAEKKTMWWKLALLGAGLWLIVRNQ